MFLNAFKDLLKDPKGSWWRLYWRHSEQLLKSSRDTLWNVQIKSGDPLCIFHRCHQKFSLAVLREKCARQYRKQVSHWAYYAVCFHIPYISVSVHFLNALQFYIITNQDAIDNVQTIKGSPLGYSLSDNTPLTLTQAGATDPFKTNMLWAN